ncbi:MAG TPA: Ig-like domain-containing protein, partial [Aggregatilineales bacterium]|nr:Ig-like domain-containing protein [Aggregatilineales bacterium]
MRRSLLLVIVVAVALGVLSSTPIAHSADEVVSPQVVDTTPSRGEELAPTNGITFYFDQAMDQSSVEAAFTSKPAVQGAFDWPNDSTVTFQPAAPLSRSTSYEFVVSDKAHSKAGPALRDNYTLRLQTPGALVVAQALPAKGSKDIETLPTITVIFNRPVVPLGSIEYMRKYASPIVISPAAEGQGQWLSTSIYTFKPKGLSGGTTYRVTVKKGLKDVSGSVLANDYTFDFQTVTPRVIEMQPTNNTAHTLRDQQVTVAFSQPMDHPATEAAFALKGDNGQAVPGDFSWNDASTSVVFTPKKLLDYGSAYTASINGKQAVSATGSALSADAITVFSTIATPDIETADPQDGDAAQPYGGMRLTFTAPMDFKDFKNRLTVDPKPGADYDVYSNDYDPFTIALGYSTEPSANYTVTIDTTGLIDKYGTPFQADPQNGSYRIVGQNKIQIKYTTSAYPPEASLRTAGYLGLYSAYRVSTRVYSTHRNIDQIDLSLYSVPLQDFLDQASQGNYGGNYNATDFLRRWSLKVENPHNVLRYDLLTITDQGPSAGAPPAASVSCPGAPVTRLKVGANGVVLSDDPRPIRVRSTAGLKGTQVAMLPPGTTFKIVDGPICADSFVWWKLTTTDKKTTGWVAEGDSQHYFIGTTDTAPAGPAPAANTSVNAPSLKPGVYLLEMSSPQLPSDSAPVRHMMLIATANITLKTSQDRLLAWVTDLQSGQPLHGVSVQFYRRVGDNGPVTSAGAPVKTDTSGLATVNLSPAADSSYMMAYAVVNDGKNLGVGASAFSDGIQAYDFNMNEDYSSRGITAYVYSDRSLYRPGQPVYFRGVVRFRDDMKYTLDGEKTIPVEIFDDQNQSLYKKDV